MAQGVLRLKAIEATSPTLAEVLRVCKLRAGLRRAGDSGRYVLGNPKVWLGTAYHAVLERAGSGQGHEFEAWMHGLWEAAVQHEYSRARAHQLDRRFGPPESWPGYHVVAAMAYLRATELALAGGWAKKNEDCTRPRDRTVRSFSAAGGKIVGRPDMIRGNEIVDFKSGDVFEDEGLEQIRSSYVRQLRIYGLLVRETLGWWPRRGVLMPMIGSPVEVALEPDECKKAAAEAVRLMEEFNASINLCRDPVELASPSATTCRWCSFQLYCPAFWRHVEPEWADDLRAGAIVGMAEGQPLSIHNGLALSLSVRVDKGTVEASQSVSLFPIDREVHAEVGGITAGDRVRVTGLSRRADQSLVVAKRTLIAQEDNLPRILVG